MLDDLRQRVPAETVAFDFNLQLAEAGDKTDSATVPLSEGRKKVSLGRLAIEAVSADATGPCVAITFNPVVLPKDIEASNDQ